MSYRSIVLLAKHELIDSGDEYHMLIQYSYYNIYYILHTVPEGRGRGKAQQILIILRSTILVTPQ